MTQAERDAYMRSKFGAERWDKALEIGDYPDSAGPGTLRYMSPQQLRAAGWTEEAVEAMLGRKLGSRKPSKSARSDNARSVGSNGAEDRSVGSDNARSVGSNGAERLAVEEGEVLIERT